MRLFYISGVICKTVTLKNYSVPSNQDLSPSLTLTVNFVS